MTRRLQVILGAVTALVLAAGGFALVSISSHSRHIAVAVAAPTPSPPTQTPTVAPTPVPVPHDVVAPAPPTAFEISGPGFDIKASVCAMPYIRPLDPPGNQEHTVCWVKQGFGVAPGSSSGGTSYILGHSWSKDPLEVFNPMSELAMTQVTGEASVPQSGVPTYPVTNLNGYRVTVQTPTGILVYTVTRAFAVAKDQAANVQSLMANTPDRVVLITCGVTGGVDADFNIIVDAYLVSSTAAA
jgi:hypothetical protein